MYCKWGKVAVAYYTVVVIALIIDATFLYHYLTERKEVDIEAPTSSYEETSSEVHTPVQLPDVTEDTPTTDSVAEDRPTYENTCAYDYEYVLRVVAAECRGEPYEGQMAVAQCILNTAWARSMTPEEVVKEKNQYAKPVSNLEHIELVREACDAVFFRGETVTDEPIRFFYATRNGFVSEGHERRYEFVMQIGDHKFFKVKEEN